MFEAAIVGGCGDDGFVFGVFVRGGCGEVGRVVAEGEQVDVHLGREALWQIGRRYPSCERNEIV